jgi:adenosine kinase
MDIVRNTKKFVIGLGNPIIDISANSTEEIIKRFNLSWGGTVFKNDENVGFYDVLESQPDVTYIPGGSVTNSIRVTNVIKIIKFSGCWKILKNLVA